MTANLAVAGLRAAIARRSPVGTVIVHWDSGSQCRARRSVAVLKTNKLSGSMGCVAAAGDNAAMESFFALLQKNVLDRRRRQCQLGKLTPIEFKIAVRTRHLEAT
jgi:putative transposase